MTEAEKRRALGLPAQTEADIRAAELARMADEGPVAERVGRPSAIGEYRLAGETAPRQAPSQPVRAEIGPPLETTGRELVPYTPPGVPATLPSRQGGAGPAAARPWEGPALGTTSFRPTDLPLIAAMGGLGAAAAGSMLIPRSANQGPASAPSAPSETGQPVGGFDRMADTPQPVGGFDRMPSAPARAPVVQAARAATQPSRETVQTPPQRTAPSTGSSFLDNIFGGGYQSTGEKVREGKKVNFGNPDVAADFFRGSEELLKDRASGGRTGSPKPDAVHKALEIIHHLIMKG